jgi:hypothetical protein
VIFLAAPISADSPPAQKALTVKTAKNTSISELIKSLGYSLDDRNIQEFLRDFMQMNKDIKSLSVIPKGTAVKMPLKWLTEKSPKMAMRKKRGPSKRKEEKERPLQRVRSDEIVLRNLGTLLYALTEVSSFTSKGVKVFSLGDKNEISLDTSAFPLVELPDKTMIVLDYRGILPEELKDVIEVTWPEYRIVSGHGIQGLKSSIAELLNAVGYSSFNDSTVVFGGKAKIELRPDFVVKKVSDDIFSGEIIAVSIVTPNEYKLPDAFKEWAGKEGIRIVELFLREPPLFRELAEVQALPERDLKMLSQSFLALLGFPVKRGETLRISGDKDYEFTMKTDVTVVEHNTVKAIQFSEVPSAVDRYAKSRGFDVLSISPNEERWTVLRKIMGFLSLNYTDNPEKTASYITPRKAKYRLSMPGTLVRSKKGLFFFTDTDTDVDVFSSLMDDHVKLIRF